MLHSISDLEMNTWILLSGSFLLLIVLLLSVINRWRRVNDAIKEILNRIGLGSDIDQVIEIAGYSYDAKQDIFVSTMYAWQRDFGYCRLYDEAAAPLSMIIDCEPIYFEYDGKKWMIELWKGQYGITTGCEVGVYNTEGPDLNIPGVFNGTFYHCVSDKDRLPISYSIKKNGQLLFTRSDVHWWLTGFILGEFSEPYDLSMDITIKLKDTTMRQAFTQGLLNAGYHQDEIAQQGNSVYLHFDHPLTPQPYTRTPVTDAVIQKKNKRLCEMYQELTRTQFSSFIDFEQIKEQAPELYDAIQNIGKHKSLFAQYEKIKSFFD